jgi:hypothetical protein
MDENAIFLPPLQGLNKSDNQPSIDAIRLIDEI